MSRLNHFLLSDEWEDHFLGVFQCALPRFVSDHCPVTLKGGGVKKGKTPLCFENMWLLMDGFKEIVRKWRIEYMVIGTSSHCLVKKLKAPRKDLRVWNKEVFGNVSFRKLEVFSHVQLWDSRERDNPLSIEEVEARKGPLKDYKKWVLLEETSWRQKSKEI